MSTVDIIRDRIAGKKFRWKFRNCSICESPISYLIDCGAVFFDSNCDCTDIGCNLEPRSLEEFAHTFDSQIPTVRDRLLANFLAKADAAPVIEKFGG